MNANGRGHSLAKKRGYRKETAGENEELMDKDGNGKAVAEILETNGTTVKYHVMEGICHYGVCSSKFREATKLAIEWFDKYLTNPNTE